MTCQQTGQWVDDVKRSLRNEVTELLLERALTLSAAMKEKDVDEEKLARAAA